MPAGRWGRWGIRVSAFVLAFFLWLHAVTEHTYTTEARARLYVHDPPASPGVGREVLVANAPPEFVDITVSGRGKDLLRLDDDSFALHLRPDGLAGTTRSYGLTSDMIEAREDVAVAVESVADPRELEIALDWRAQRSVSVRPRISLSPAEPYVLVGAVAIEPAVVEISGPSAQLRAVTFVETDTLTLADVQEDVDHYIRLALPAGVKCRVEPARVRVRADIQILAQDDLQQVPVEVRNSDNAQVRAEPPRVRVRVKGGIDIIAKIDPEKDVGLYVDAGSYGGGPLPIRHDEERLFEVTEISPARIQLIGR
jgi:YbbR domain-containing protein